MKAKIFQPHPALRPFVRLYYILQANFPPIAAMQHITPKGEPALFLPFCQPAIFSFNLDARNLKADNGCLLNPTLVGQSNGYGLFNWAGNVNYCIVALRPNAHTHFIRESGKSTVNSFYSFEHLGLDGDWRDLANKLIETADVRVVVQLVEQFLLRHFLGGAKLANPTNVLPVTDWIERCSGMVSVGSLSDKFRVTPRRLEQQFDDELGISPKEFSRIVRFRNVVRRMYMQRQLSWMRMVADYNYTDQSHLIRDFRQFAGVTPVALSLERPIFDQMVYQEAFS